MVQCILSIKMRNEIKYLHNRFSCKLMLLDILVIGFGRDIEREREREKEREREFMQTHILS